MAMSFTSRSHKICLVNGFITTLIPPRRSFFLRNCYNFIEMAHFTVRAWILSRISSLTTNFSSIKLCKKFVSLITFFTSLNIDFGGGVCSEFSVWVQMWLANSINLPILYNSWIKDLDPSRCRVAFGYR